jgi:hypothetical protein
VRERSAFFFVSFIVILFPLFLFLFRVPTLYLVLFFFCMLLGLDNI